MSEVSWCCPQDRGALAGGTGAELRCTSCGATYRTEGGIAHFAAAAAPPPDDDRLARLWARVRGGDLETGIAELVDGTELSRYRSGADWFSLFPAPSGEPILEIGPGLGDDTIELARNGRILCAAHDATAASIVARRMEDAGIEPAVAVLDGLDALPLADAMLGGLAIEGDAASAFGVQPETLFRVAQEFARVVKPGGALYLGVVNPWPRRLGFDALQDRLRAKPRIRSLQRELKRERSRRGARASRADWTEALTAHGFAAPQVYAPLPDQHTVQVVLPVEDRAVVRYFLDNLVRKNSRLAQLAVHAAGLATDAGLFTRAVPFHFLFFERQAR